MRPKTVSDRALRFFGRRNLIKSDWEDAHEAAEKYKKMGDPGRQNLSVPPGPSHCGTQTA